MKDDTYKDKPNLRPGHKLMFEGQEDEPWTISEVRGDFVTLFTKTNVREVNIWKNYEVYMSDDRQAWIARKR